MSQRVCVPCRKFFKIKLNGVAIEEGMPAGGKDGMWRPYKLWLGDLYACEGCDTEMIFLPDAPVAEHYQKDYAEWVQRLQPAFRVDDCPGSYHGRTRLKPSRMK